VIGLVADSFWKNFFLLLIFIPLAMAWAFALVDIFRRDDINGLPKALWLLCVLVVPFLGTFVYVLLRPPGATREERARIERAEADFAAPPHGASALQVLADLHDRGKLTDAEFEAEKARALGASAPAPR
jgi:hypothetical protein